MFLFLALLALPSALRVNAEETFGSSVTPLTAFVCVDGWEIPLANLCDGMPHCPDSSDETGKLCRRITCPVNKYRCKYGACVARAARCDGMEDCADGSDEFRCDEEAWNSCSDREFECSLSAPRGECIPLADVCNGYEDCSDGSDESADMCREYPCPGHRHRCTYGGCVHQEVLCDGIKDCVDGSDEHAATCARVNCTEPVCEEFECRHDEFSCGNGNQCVPVRKVCDGTRQCRDSSDEDASTCASRVCPEGWFRCAYGACIRPELRCDQRPDCYDWSDEEESLCGVSLPEGACRLPAATPDTHYSVGGCPRCRPADVVPELTRLDYACATEAVLEGASTVYCQGNRWTPSVPTCQPGNSSNGITCPGLVESRGAAKRCEAKWGPHRGWLPSCDRSLPIGTRAFLECPAFYQRVSGSSSPMCLHDGTWSQPALSCSPVCGKRATLAAALIVHGWELKPRELLPWHASLFSREDGQWKFFCGGTLIAERLVLTAAHCVWKTSADTVRVALGISSVDLEEAGDEAQVLDVAAVRLQEAYQDHEANYGSDLAILVLRRPASINSFVAPACLDLRSDFAVVEAQGRGQIGLVVGMGLTENDTFSRSLRATTVKIVPDEECRQSQKRDFRKYLTYTSFCAGWANGTGVCNGDSGGGLVLRRPNTTAWEVHGVVSLSPRRLGTSICDPRFYTVFTKVAVYGEWIRRIMESIPVLGPTDIDAHPNRDQVIL